MKASGSISSCAAAPAAREIPANHASSSPPRGSVLLVQFGIQSLLAGRFAPPADPAAPITNPIVIAEVARAQRIVDQQNLEIRRTLGPLLFPESSRSSGWR